MVQDDRLTHNSIMVSTKEDCFTTRRLSVEVLQIHTQSDFLNPDTSRFSVAFQKNVRFLSSLADKRDSNFYKVFQKDN